MINDHESEHKKFPNEPKVAYRNKVLLFWLSTCFGSAKHCIAFYFRV